MKLLIFIPAYNEEETISSVINSIPRINKFDEQEVLVVDDGSSDKTAKIAEASGAIVISHTKNKGVGGAFHTGVQKALEIGADIMLTIDADGQFPVEKMDMLIKPILKGEAEFVTASRFLKREDYPQNISSLKLWGNKNVARIISSLLGRKFHDVACGFRAYSKEALMNLNVFGKFTYTQEVFIDLSMKGIAIKEIPIGGVRYFKNRKSRVFKGALSYAVKSLTIIFRAVRDYKPLRFFSFVAALIFLIGLLLDGFLFGHYLIRGRFSPFIFMGFIGAFFNIIGIILFIVGMLADMLDRMRMNQEKILLMMKKLYYEKS